MNPFRSPGMLMQVAILWNTLYIVSKGIMLRWWPISRIKIQLPLLKPVMDSTPEMDLIATKCWYKIFVWNTLFSMKPKNIVPLTSRRHLTLTPLYLTGRLTWVSRLTSMRFLLPMIIIRPTFFQIGVVQGDVLTFTDDSTFCRDSISYRVRAVGFFGTDERSFSDLSANAPIRPLPVLATDIAYATVVADSVVEIAWTEYTGYRPDQYLLQKSVDGMSWDSIGTFPFGTQLFTDPDVSVGERSYYYRVFNIDQCGDRSLRGFIGRTIHLTATMGNNGRTPILSWNSYEEWGNGVLNYQVEVFNENSGQFELVDNVAADLNSFQDDQTNINQADYCYRIVATEVGGNGARSVSNVACVTFAPKIFAPNAFTPNNDGTNDFFRVFVPNIASGELKIYNRWGQQVYISNDLSRGWDGTYQGSAVQEGVYVFVVTANGVDGSTITRQGTVTLIR
jgi:gliding motility-associated-like protein